MWHSLGRSFVGKNKPYKLASMAVAFLFFCLILLNNVSLFALNANYLDESKWVDNSKIITVSLDGKTSVKNTLNGTFKYFVDNDNGCMYMYFSVTESSITSSNDLVKIGVTVNTDDYEYKFSIDEEGICDSLTEEESYFTVQQSFSKASNGGTFIAGFQFSNKSQSTVSIDLYINSHKYNVIDGVAMGSSLTTTNTKSSSKAKSTTSKSTTKASKAKASTTQTTKFSGSAESTTAFAKSSAAIATQSNDNTTSNSKNSAKSSTQTAQSKTKLSSTAKTLIISSSAVGGTGTMLLILALITKFASKGNKDF